MKYQFKHFFDIVIPTDTSNAESGKMLAVLRRQFLKAFERMGKAKRLPDALLDTVLLVEGLTGEGPNHLSVCIANGGSFRSSSFQSAVDTANAIQQAYEYTIMNMLTVDGRPPWGMGALSTFQVRDRHGIYLKADVESDELRIEAPGVEINLDAWAYRGEDVS